MGVRSGRLIVLDTDTNVNGPCSFDPHHCHQGPCSAADAA